jgi:hypothetical protein
VKPVETPVSEGILTTVEMQATAVTPTRAGTPEHRLQSQQELQGDDSRKNSSNRRADSRTRDIWNIRKPRAAIITSPTHSQQQQQRQQEQYGQDITRVAIDVSSSRDTSTSRDTSSVTSKFSDQKDSDKCGVLNKFHKKRKAFNVLNVV